MSQHLFLKVLADFLGLGHFSAIIEFCAKWKLVFVCFMAAESRYVPVQFRIEFTLKCFTIPFPTVQSLNTMIECNSTVTSPYIFFKLYYHCSELLNLEEFRNTRFLASLFLEVFL